MIRGRLIKNHFGDCRREDTLARVIKAARLARQLGGRLGSLDNLEAESAAHIAGDRSKGPLGCDRRNRWQERRPDITVSHKESQDKFSRSVAAPAPH